MRQLGQARPVDLPRHGFHDEVFDEEDPRWDRWLWKLPRQGLRDLLRPFRRCGCDLRNTLFGDRRGGDECDQFLVLVVEHSRLDLPELGLEDILDGLNLDAVPAHFQLRVEAPEEVHLPRHGVDPALVPGAVEPAELRVRDEFFSRLLRQVAVAARHLDAADA